MTLFLSLALLLAFSTKALANPACAVCTVAVGASLEIARHYGVDDAVVGVWAGALLALLGYWLILWFDKKNWHFFGRDILLMVISVGSVGFMYISQIPYRPQPILVFYMDPLLFSTILGALTFIYFQILSMDEGPQRRPCAFSFRKSGASGRGAAVVEFVFQLLPAVGQCGCFFFGCRRFV